MFLVKWRATRGAVPSDGSPRPPALPPAEKKLGWEFLVLFFLIEILELILVLWWLDRLADALP